jgi:hypothetical protein
MKDGVTKILTPTDWWVKRRPEIWNLVQKEIYGNAFPDSFNGGAVLSPATTPYPSAINNWTISTGTPGTVAGNISVSTVAG